MSAGGAVWRGSIDAGEYRARDRGAFFPRDFAVADFVQAFHGFEKAWDSRVAAAVARRAEEAEEGFHARGVVKYAA